MNIARTRPAPQGTIRAFERRYLHDHTQEHALLFDAAGHLVVERDGSINRVEFSPAELDRACMGLLTHTHPKGRPLSGEDLTVAAEYGLTLRATGVNADGVAVTYMVRFRVPSRDLAATLFSRFPEEEAKAHAELAVRAEYWTDEQWLQHARDLAVSRMANEYGFMYSRVSLVAEMGNQKRTPQSDEAERLTVLSKLENDLRSDVFGPMLASVIRLLVRYSNGAGQVEPGRTEQVRREAGVIVQRTMLGQAAQDGTLLPYRLQHGRVIPQSAYFKVLWEGLLASAAAGVERQARIMRKYLPEDIRRAFELASINPFEHTVSEAGGDPLNDILPEYDPLHQWLGPDNKQLSDRIWNATGDMRRRLDLYLRDAIAQGKSIEQMSAELEEFLLPGRKLIRSTGPWGTDLSFDAMRLARTEVNAAYHRADYAAAMLNPLVESYQPFTSPAHDEVDDCDTQRDNGPYPKSDPSHLPPFHAQCLCGVVWLLADNPNGIVQSLRDRIAQGIANAQRTLADLIGPLSKRFLDLLFRGRS